MHLLECPSGLIIEADSLDSSAIIQIAERIGANASGQTLAAFMRAATKRIVDPGPYPTLRAGEVVPNWNSVLWGDLLSAIIQLRIMSFPSHKGNFDFEFSCPGCRKLVPGGIDLAELLADSDHCAPLPDESKEILLSGKMFEFVLPSSGKRVEFDLARADQDEPMRILMQREKRTKETDIEVIAKRLRFVEGLENKTGPIKDLRSIWRWCCKSGSLVFDDIDALLSEMARVDVLFDTKILAWCNNHAGNCGRQSRIQLPLDVSFFRPRSGTKRGKTDSPEVSPSSSPESPAIGG